MAPERLPRNECARSDMHALVTPLQAVLHDLARQPEAVRHPLAEALVTFMHRLSGYGYINVGLPPASPSEREIVTGVRCCAYAVRAHRIAGLRHHRVPAGWVLALRLPLCLGASEGWCADWLTGAQVRSNHERLIRLSGASQTSKDNPLKLQSTTDWATESAHRPWGCMASSLQTCKCGM